MPSDIETVDKLGVMHLGGCVNDDDVGIATALDRIVLHNKLQNQIEACMVECLEANWVKTSFGAEREVV